MSSRKKLTAQILRERLGLKPSERLSKMLREQAMIRSKIYKSISREAKTVPEIAKETGLDTQTVFWFLMTYYRHGLIHEEGKTDEGYFKYRWKR